ncbi:MAG: PepSY domain-containing protein [Pseudomonadota bacterium]|nr:PepSY domain-containing protein [Pseudomonadota bacterium]
MKTQKTLKSALLASAAFAVVVPTMALAAIKVGDTLGTDEAAIINALEVAGYERIEVEFEDDILEAEGWDPVNAMEMEFEIDPETGLVSAVSVEDEDEADEDDDADDNDADDAEDDNDDADEAEDDDMEDADGTDKN